LRQQHGLPPIPPPAIDLSPKPDVLAPGPFDCSLLARQFVRYLPIAMNAALSPVGDPEEAQVLWQESKTAVRSLLNAHDGKMRELWERVRKGTATLEERQYAADLRESKLVRPTRRPKELRTQLRRELALEFITTALEPAVLAKTGWSSEDLVKKTQELLGRDGLSRTVVYKIIAVVKSLPPRPVKDLGAGLTVTDGKWFAERQKLLQAALSPKTPT
jgi:hypothetical protein